MNRIVKRIIYIIIGLFLTYLTILFFVVFFCGHRINSDNFENYSWLFKDSIIEDIDKEYYYSYENKYDEYNNFHYKNAKYLIGIWDLRKTNINSLNDINLVKSNFYPEILYGETFDKKSEFEVTAKFGFSFDDKMIINIDNYSKILKQLKSKNYKGFLGTVNKLSFCNSKNEPQFYMDISFKTPTLFLVYKTKSSLYLIAINSEHEFNEDIIKILNLK
jgi:hypothetical protein